MTQIEDNHTVPKAVLPVPRQRSAIYRTATSAADASWDFFKIMANHYP